MQCRSRHRSGTHILRGGIGGLGKGGGGRGEGAAAAAAGWVAAATATAVEGSASGRYWAVAITAGAKATARQAGAEAKVPRSRR